MKKASVIAIAMAAVMGLSLSACAFAADKTTGAKADAQTKTEDNGKTAKSEHLVAEEFKGIVTDDEGLYVAGLEYLAAALFADEPEKISIDGPDDKKVDLYIYRPQVTGTVAFDNESDALSWAKDHRPDIAFLDIRMHGMDGLLLAQRLRVLHPELAIVFCTGYEHYAISAMNLHIDASYLMKPLQPEVVARELDRILSNPPEKLLDVVCFGNFEVFAGGKPLSFDRRISKELMACLIDRRGASMTVPELHSIACESRQNLSRQSVYQALYSLKRVLASVGAEEVLISGPGSYSIDMSRINCDYYKLLEGDEKAALAFMGEYMKQYPWAEVTCGWLIMNIENRQK